VHSLPVNEVSFDSDGEYVGSCSDDGTVVISSLYTDEKEKFEYHRPVKSVALDPEYARKGSKQFALGGLAGQLLFLSKGWLGYKEKVQIQRHFKALRCNSLDGVRVHLFFFSKSSCSSAINSLSKQLSMKGKVVRKVTCLSSVLDSALRRRDCACC